MVEYLNVLNPIPRALTSSIIKLTIWILPVFLIVRLVEKRNPWSYLGLRHNVFNGFRWAGVISLAFITCFVILNFIILSNSIDFNLGFNQWLNTILLVGIIEEIVFRGFLLIKFMEVFRFWKANIITSLLFVSIHFPIWMYRGLFDFPGILGPIATSFFLSLLFGFIYKKTNSLWSVIIIHSLYNLLVSIFN